MFGCSGLYPKMQVNQIPSKLTASEPPREDTAVLTRKGIFLEHLSVPNQDPALQYFAPLAWVHKDTDG